MPLNSGALNTGPLNAASATGGTITLIAAVPAPSLIAQEHPPITIGPVLLTVPAPRMRAEVTALFGQVAATVPAPAMTAYGGGQMVGYLPLPLMTASVTTQLIGRGEFVVPMPVMVATVTMGSVGRLVATMPLPLITAHGGGRAAMTAPRPTLIATGTVGGVMQLRATLPLPMLTATVVVGHVACMQATMPSPVMIARSGGRLVATLPWPLLVARGGIANAALEETTYAINLATGAVTTLALGAVSKLVTAFGRLYILRPDGSLACLDQADAAVDAQIRFAQQDFSTNFLKRLAEVYLSTRQTDGLQVDLIADEQETWRYQAPATDESYHTTKVSVGKGVKFHTAGLIVRNRNGGRLAIGNLEMPVQILSRKPR